MKRTNILVRVAAGVLAVLLLLSGVIGGLGMTGFAAEETRTATAFDIYERDEGGAVPSSLRNGNTYYFKFYCSLKENESGLTSANIEGSRLRLSSAEISRNTWSGLRDMEEITASSDGEYFTVEGSFTAIYRGSSSYNSGLVVTVDNDVYDFDVEISTSEDDFSRSTSSGSSDDSYDDEDTYTDTPPTPKIMVENMVALDSAGHRIDEITKDSPPFTLEVVFADVGLQHTPYEDIDERYLEAYVTAAGGFILGTSSKGTVKLLGEGDYPRFRAQFRNVTYTGGDKTLGFTVFYDLGFLEPVSGVGTGTLFSATAEGEDEEEEDSTAGIKVPKIIVSSYSYGEEAIVAGAEFPLDFTVTNTSADLPLENIVITLTPAAPEGAEKGPGLIVASSSNTIYLPSLGPGASHESSVSFKARPDAEVTSHLVNARFSYEYQKSEKEGYVAAPELTESIAIPVSQIDRFSVDPIQDSPYGEVGQEAYLSVNFINKGKSPTYNVSGTVEIDESVSAPPQHYGNLEAGASDSLDFYLTGSMAGTFEGVVILQYEDDNGTVKETRSPFSMTVDEPWMPPMDPGMMDPGMMEEPPAAGPNLLTVILCAAGGLAIAVPLALYLMKRVRAKGREEFDESI